MMFDASLQAFQALHTQFGPLLDTGLLIFARTLAFVSTGPIFSRKNLPILIKIVMALFLTVSMLWVVPIKAPGSSIEGASFHFLFQIVVNITLGMILGFMANMLLLTISSAGNVLNNQIGLSSAMLLDPSTGTQTMVMEPLFNLIGTLVFIHLGGLYWLINALKRSFTVFPVYQVQHDLPRLLNLEYIVQLSGDTLTVAVQMVAPVMVVTMAVDLILGIVNRTAQQMPVFQLSFALKPAVGIAIILMTLPILISSMAQFLNDHSQIF